MWLFVVCRRCARWFAGARCCFRVLVMRVRCLLMLGCCAAVVRLLCGCCAVVVLVDVRLLFWLLFVVVCLLFGVGWCCVLLC